MAGTLVALPAKKVAANLVAGLSFSEGKLYRVRVAATLVAGLLFSVGKQFRVGRERT